MSQCKHERENKNGLVDYCILETRHSSPHKYSCSRHHWHQVENAKPTSASEYCCRCGAEA